jgi:hypothetical protein
MLTKTPIACSRDSMISSRSSRSCFLNNERSKKKVGKKTRAAWPFDYGSKSSESDADDERKGRAKVKGYLDAGMKTRESTSFYASAIKSKPMLSAKTQKIYAKAKIDEKRKFGLSELLFGRNKNVKTSTTTQTKTKKPSMFDMSKSKRVTQLKAKTIKKKVNVVPKAKMQQSISNNNKTSAYTIKKIPFKAAKEITSSPVKIRIGNGKIAEKPRAQTMVFSNFLSSFGKSTASTSSAAPMMTKKKPVVSVTKEAAFASSSPSSSAINDMSNDEIGTYGLILAFSVASFSSLVILPNALTDFFELVGVFVTGYWCYSNFIKDDDLGLSLALDEVEKSTGLDVRELSKNSINSTIELVKETVDTVSSNTKKASLAASYPKKDELATKTSSSSSSEEEDDASNSVMSESA